MNAAVVKKTYQGQDVAWLHDLDFVDLYVSLGCDLPSYYQSTEPGTLLVRPRDLAPGYHDDLVGLRRELETALEAADEASLTYDGIRFRANKIHTVRGQNWAALRRIAGRPPLMRKLGFAGSDLSALQDLGQRSGLILICGGTGQGKTTTASALLYDYLLRYGGVALSLEDPVEYLLDGRHGDAGLCYQVEIKEDEEWAKSLKYALRWHPRYIMVGELRTPEAANQLLRAANSGHLVITTMHAGAIEEALDGFLHLAEQSIGAHAGNLLASGLTAVLSQNFLTRSVSRRLYVAEPCLGEPVRALIRDRKIGQATTFIDQQMAKRAQTARG